MQPEIINTLTALENCICLLFPTPEDFFIHDENVPEIKPESSVEKPRLTKCSITNQIEGENKINTEAGLHQEDSVSELNTSDVPSTSRPKSDDDNDGEDNMEENNLDSESEMSDPEGDIDFREYGMLNSKYSIEVNVNTGIYQYPKQNIIFIVNKLINVIHSIFY
jgi:hypothetical protein